MDKTCHCEEHEVTKQSLFGKIASLLGNKMLRLLPPGFQLARNDADDMPVIPGEHRETRNPGASSFCLHA